MPGRRRAVIQGELRGRQAVDGLSRELDQAIQTLGLSYAAVGRDVGLSAAQVGRIAHGRSPELSIRQASIVLAAVGLDLTVRAYPSGRPLRDAPQLRLLAAFRSRLHRGVAWRTEVPVVTAGARSWDLRAWDATITMGRWRYGVEAETRIRDVQALERRVSLKLRDGDVDGVIVVVRRSRGNAQIVRSFGSVMESLRGVPGDVAMSRLTLGEDPGGNAVVLL